MSVKFSFEGKEILASSNREELIIYDLDSNKVSTHIKKAHNDDINSVCFAHTYNSNIIYSASDDGHINVWDRRTLANNRSVIGKFVGHWEGLTYVVSKEDGIYLASNAKD